MICCQRFFNTESHFSLGTLGGRAWEGEEGEKDGDGGGCESFRRTSYEVIRF